MKTRIALLLLAVATTGCNMLASDGLPTLGKATTIERESREQEKSAAETAANAQTSRAK